MPQNNPFADLIPQSGAAPGYIPGRTTPRQEAQDARADASAARADAAAERAAAAAERQAALDAKKLTVEGRLTESESKTTNFYNSALGAEQEWNRLGSSPALAAGREPAGVLGDAARAVLPSGVVNSMTSSARQQAEQAKLNFIRASLRLESGAAIGNSEYARQERTFYPQSGDSEETIAQKARARQQIIEGFRIGAGTGSSKVDELRGPSGAGIADTPQAKVSADGSGQVLTPEDKQFAAESQKLFNDGGTQEDFDALATRYGRQPFGEDLHKALANRAAGRPANFAAMPSGKRDTGLLGAAAGSLPGAIVAGVADTVTLGGLDEIIGATGGDTGNARLAQSIMRTERPGAYLAGEVGGGFLLPTGGATSVGRLATVGGAYGAAYGAGSADDGNRLGGAIRGGILGAGASALLAAGGNAVASRLGGGGNPPGGGNSLIDSASRQGIDVLPADVGGPFTRRLTSGIAQSPFGGGSIIRSAQRTVGQAEAARNRAGAAVGQAVEPVAAGEIASQGARDAVVSGGSARNTRNYDKAADLASGTPIKPEATRADLDRHIAELSEGAFGAPQVLTDLRARLDRDFTVQGLRNTRTQVREEIQKQGLRGSDTDRRLKDVVDTLSTDIATSLRAAGKDEAANAYLAADRAAAERFDMIDNVLEPIVGDGSLSGEKVMRNIMSATRTDSTKLRRFVEALPADDQNTLRATVINQLGRANPGAQNAEGNAFSLQTFLTHWNAMTPRAKETLFKGETRAALNDIARVAQGARETAQYANRSNTAGSMMSLVNLSTGGLQYVTGKMLASPRVAKVLASGLEPQAAVRRLQKIATREPELQQDIAEFVANVASQSPGRAAAQDERNGRPKPVQ